MKIVGLLTVVYVLGGETPDVRVIPSGFMSKAECERHVELSKQILRPENFTEDGRSILSTFTTCSPVEVDYAIEQMQKVP